MEYSGHMGGNRERSRVHAGVRPLVLGAHVVAV